MHGFFIFNNFFIQGVEGRNCNKNVIDSCFLQKKVKYLYCAKVKGGKDYEWQEML